MNQLDRMVRAPMKFDTYESLVDSGRFVTVPTGKDVATIGLPDDRAFVHLKCVRLGYVFPKHCLEHSFCRSVMQQIEARGYAIHGFDLAIYERGERDAESAGDRPAAGDD